MTARYDLERLVESCTEEQARVLLAHVDAVQEAAAPNPVTRPAHYTRSAIEVRDAITAWGLDYNRGNVVKYVARAGHKDPARELEDLEKAADYLAYEIARVRGGRR